MDTLLQLFVSWITRWQTFVPLILVLLLWLFISLILGALYDGCGDSGKFNFLKEACENEGIRNFKIINTVFPIIFGLTIVVTFFKSLINDFNS